MRGGRYFSLSPNSRLTSSSSPYIFSISPLVMGCVMFCAAIDKTRDKDQLNEGAQQGNEG